MVQVAYRSWAKPTRVCCSVCGETYDFDVWVLVDIDERPDLAERIRNPTIMNPLHRPTCPSCGTWGYPLDAPLLLYRPGNEPPLFFSPAEGTTADDNWKQAFELVRRLRASLGDGWRNGWNDQIAIVQRESLPTALAHGLEAIAGTGHGRRRLVVELDEPSAFAEIIRQEPGAAKEGSPEWECGLIALGSDFGARFNDGSGQVSDLDKALEAFQLVLNSATRGSSNWINCLIRRGHALRKRFEILKQDTDLDGAIASYRQAADGSGGQLRRPGRSESWLGR
jgi:CpXC protein